MALQLAEADFINESRLANVEKSQTVELVGQPTKLYNKYRESSCVETRVKSSTRF